MLRNMNLLSQDELARLTSPERLALITQLWDSLDNEQLPMTVEQQTELDRRMDALDLDRPQCIPWTTLKSQLERRSS